MKRGRSLFWLVSVVFVVGCGGDGTSDLTPDRQSSTVDNAPVNSGVEPDTPAAIAADYLANLQAQNWVDAAGCLDEDMVDVWIVKLELMASNLNNIAGVQMTEGLRRLLEKNGMEDFVQNSRQSPANKPAYINDLMGHLSVELEALAEGPQIMDFPPLAKGVFTEFRQDGKKATGVCREPAGQPLIIPFAKVSGEWKMGPPTGTLQ